MQISFAILNSCTSLQDYELSNAGAPRKQHMTPTMDFNFIVEGKVKDSTLKMGISPILPNKGVSPAVLTRGLLESVKKGSKHNVDTYSLNQCLSIRPDDRISMNKEAKPLSRQFLINRGSPKQDLLLKHERVSEIDYGASPLQRKMCEDHADFLYKKFMSSDILVIGECVPTGTITSSAIASLIFAHPIEDLYISGSTPNSGYVGEMSLVAKRRISSAKSLIDNLPDYQKASQQSVLEAIADLSQRTLYLFLKMLREKHPMGVSNKKIILAGGWHVAIPYIVALKHADSSLLAQITLATTRWVLDPYVPPRGLDLRKALNRAEFEHFPYVASDMIMDRFKGYEEIAPYFQGEIKEGCGAGGAMCLANLLGIHTKIQDKFLNESIEQARKFALPIKESVC